MVSYQKPCYSVQKPTHWIKMFIFLTIKQLILKRVKITFYEQKNEFSMTVAFIAPVAVTFLLSFLKNC